MQTDFLGRDLKIDQLVVFLSHSRNSSSLENGVVTGFTPCYVKVRYSYECGPGHKVSGDKVIGL